MLLKKWAEYNCLSNVNFTLSSLLNSNLLPILKNKAKEGTQKQAKRAVFCINEFTSVSKSCLSEVFFKTK